MPPAILDHLRFLYGASAAEVLQPRFAALLESWRAKLPPPRRQTARVLALTPSDALLITYADQVFEPGATPLRALGDFSAHHLAGVVSGLHLLPFYPWSSDDGFSVKDYHAVDPAFGTWDDIHALGRQFDLMFDAVFNHMSAQSEWFARFTAGDPAFHDFFVSVEGEPDLSRVIRPRALPLLTEFNCAGGPRKIWTTFSADQVDLNLRNPDVLLALVDVLLGYIGHGAKFIRLDAIAFLWKEIGTTCLHLPQTHRAIQLLRAVVDELAPGTMLVTETNVPHVDNLSYFGDGTNEAQLVYNFALPPLVLHALATGDARTLSRWAQSLELPSRCVALFNFLASHDGIGLNPARGILSDAEIDALVARTLRHGGFISYKHLPDGLQVPYEMNISFFDALSDPAAHEPDDVPVRRMLCAHGIQLALAGVPGLYFHSLFGSRSDRPGAEASGIPRRINRQKNTREELERGLMDPDSLRSRVFTGMKRLLRARRAHEAFHPCGQQQVLESDSRLFVVQRTSPERSETVLCIHNVSTEAVEAVLPLPESASPLVRCLHGPPAAVATGSGMLTVRLAPYDVLWARLGHGSPPPRMSPHR